MATIPGSLISALENGFVIPFVGAGVSLAVKDRTGKALFPSWKELLQRAVQRLRDENLIEIANLASAHLELREYLEAAKAARRGLGGNWHGFLIEQFKHQSSEAQPESLNLAKSIWKLGSPLVVTTNYDRVLHWASPNLLDIRSVTVSDQSNLRGLSTLLEGEPTVWHLHGAIDQPDDIILTPDGYQLLYPGKRGAKVRHTAAISALRGLLAQRTFLFIGFGMEQAMKDQINWVSRTFAGAGGQHFVLVTEDNQAAMEKDLFGLSVQSVPYPGHHKLPALVEELASYSAQGASAHAPKRLEPDPVPYLELLRDRTAHLDIPTLETNQASVQAFPIAKLYIPLVDERKGHRLEKSLTDSSRLVILGHPGSGKTTFLCKLANTACLERLADVNMPFPVFVSAAALAEFIEGQAVTGVEVGPTAISAFLASQCRDISNELDTTFFEGHLSGGPSMLLVDGLDEALSIDTRIAVARLIEQASVEWTECVVAVTSRIRGYEGTVTLAGFDSAIIGPLDHGSIRDFLKRWSGVLFPRNSGGAERNASELIAAVESRLEIQLTASSPLMLTALAVLHWNERRIVEHRAEIFDWVLKWLARSRGKEAERRLRIFAELAAAMQLHPNGRQTQVSREWAAEVVAPLLDTDHAGAYQFLQTEEVHSNIIVSQGGDLKFWHLIFQEHLAAKLLSTKFEDADRRQILFNEGRAWLPEWREVVLLLAVELHQLHPKRADALVSALLDHSSPDLNDQARCAGLLGAILRDLQPLQYRPSVHRCGPLMKSVLGIFEAAARLPLESRLDAADALGLLGDPRLRTPIDHDYWVQLETFEIGKYPVTVWEYAHFIAGAGPKPDDWDRQLLHLNCPVANVTWDDARGYCDWASVRLPTEGEWERAARGAEGRKYPWGEYDPSPERANYDETPLARLTPVGLFPLGSTPEGIADLAGNVWEWCADWYDEEKTRRVLRGGSRRSKSMFLLAEHRDSNHPSSRDVDLGFRCARNFFASLTRSNVGAGSNPAAVHTLGGR